MTDVEMTEMTRADVLEAMQRMNKEELGLLEQLSLGKTPIEAVRLLEFFHYFPDCRMVDGVPQPDANTFEDDGLETRTRLDVWNEQDDQLADGAETS